MIGMKAGRTGNTIKGSVLVCINPPAIEFHIISRYFIWKPHTFVVLLSKCYCINLIITIQAGL